MSEMFRALVLRQDGKAVTAGFEERAVGELPEGDVLVRVNWTTVNYKDGMILGGIGRLVRDYPHVPGIDFSGVVARSEHPDFRPGDRVVLTGWRVGETRWGGYGEYARVPGDWLVALPAAIGLREAMAIGTAGFTAMLAVRTLERHGLRPGAGEVLVTGAAGGVGSVATAILARLGHAVAGSTGRPETADYLRGLGAATLIDRAELAAAPSRPLARERFAGAIDSVGGTTLANLLTQMRYGSAVAAVGLAGGSELATTVLPFLLRGVSLLGIDSVMCPPAIRRDVWGRLATDLPMDRLAAMTTVHAFADLPRLGREILAGRLRGRAIVEVAPAQDS